VTVTTPSGTTNAIQFTAPSVGPLRVTSVQPMRNAVAAPRRTPVSVTFDKPLTNSAATQGSLRVFGQQSGGRKAGAVGVSGNTLSLAPATPFQPGETVYATVTKAAEGSGGTLATPQVFQFTTATAASAGTFAAPTVAANSAVPTSFSTDNVVTGDIDGDGDLDLLTANGNVNVRLNNGAGIFTTPANGTVPTNGASNLVLGDVDGDGDLDLLTANYYTNSVSVRLNNGAGIFTAPAASEVPVGIGPVDLVVGDVDGDGDLDLLTANTNSPATVSVRLNNGAGVFTAPTNGTVSMASSANALNSADALVLGDIDGDGDLDLLTANGLPGTVSIRLNDGAGNFTIPAVAANGTVTNLGAYTLAVGDVDGDGDLDLLTANYGTTFLAGASGSLVNVLLNNGAGVFAAPAGAPTILAGRNANKLVLGDVDGDGDLDLLTANNGDRTASVRLNNGAGMFAPPTIAANGTIDVGGTAYRIAVGDLDGDGDLDLIAPNSNGNNVLNIRLNQSLAPVLTSISTPTGTSLNRVTVTGVRLAGATEVSFNGQVVSKYQFTNASDTQITLILPANVTSGPVTVTNPNGVSSPIQFVAPPFLTGVQPKRNAPSDPRNTAVSVSFGQALSNSATTLSGLRVFSQQAGGRKMGTASVSGNTLRLTPTTPFQPGETVYATVTKNVQSADGASLIVPQVFQFTAATAPATGQYSVANTAFVGAGPSSPVLGDVDGDGDLDLLVATTSRTISVRLNSGYGAYAGSLELPLDDVARQIVLGDVDGDSDLDVVAVLQNGTVRLLRNQGNGSFTAASFPATDAGQGIAQGDVDADGDLDLVLTKPALGLVSVFTNDGLGAFTGFSTSGIAKGINPVPVLGDVDGDGDLDLLVTDYSNRQARIYVNIGGAFFGTQATAAGGGGFVDALTVGDIDNDGDLDLLTASYTSSRVSVRRNTNGFFGGTEEVDLQARGPLTLALGDVDGDGDLDLITTNQNTRTIGVRLNNGTGSFSGSQEAGLHQQLPAGLALGDVDGDGDLDIVTPHAASSQVDVLLNQNPLASTTAQASQVAEGGAMARTSLLQLSPNPSNGRLVVHYSAQQAQAATLVVSDRLGRTVQQQTLQLQAGENEVALDLSGQAQGLYQVLLRPAHDQPQAQKLVLNP
jgi:hypothetical protein